MGYSPLSVFYFQITGRVRISGEIKILAESEREARKILKRMGLSEATMMSKPTVRPPKLI